MAIVIKYRKKVDEDAETENGSNENPSSNGTDSTNAGTDKDSAKKQQVDSKTEAEIAELKNAIALKKEQLLTRKNTYNTDIKTITQQKNQLESQIARESDSDKIKMLNTKVVELEKQARDKETVYDNDKRMIDLQILQYKAKIAGLGGTIDFNESIKSFGKKIYESLTNKTEEMFGLVSMVFDSMSSEKKISYYPSRTNQMGFAKKIIAYINEGNFANGDAMTNFSDFLIDMLNRSQIPFFSREKTDFTNRLIGEMSQNEVFSWIFDDKNN